MNTALLVIVGAVLALAAVALVRRRFGFVAQRPQDYDGQGPVLDLREHLNGPLLCEGVIYGPTGRVASRFVADMDVSWDGNVGTMTEEFRYDSGATQSRCWEFTVGNDGRVRATAPDLVGAGTGEQRGPSVCLNYKIRLPESAGGHVLDTTDWMYLMENGAIINRSQFRKYGIKVAELIATLRKTPQDATQAAE